MTTFIALVRGINVGGRRKILMTDLSKLFQRLGFTNIQTYIQSGNVIFETDTKTESLRLSLTIEEAIFDSYGFEVPVIVRTAGEIEVAILNNPFLKTDSPPENLFFTFLKEEPIAENLKAIKNIDFPSDKFEIIGKDVFGFCAEKYHKTKLSNQFFEKKLKVSATTRNWKTVLKLLEMAGGK